MTSYDARALRRWKETLSPYRRPAPQGRPSSSALLVIDMQRYFAAMCAPIQTAIKETVEACHTLDMPVFYTQHGHADPNADGGMLASWWGDLIVEGTRGHELMDDLGRHSGDVVIPKRRYDGFFGTDLERLLREGGVQELAVAGVMTNLCVETTARSAFVRDFRVRVLMDATATADESMHVAALINLAYGFAHVQTADEWLSNVA